MRRLDSHKNVVQLLGFVLQTGESSFLAINIFKFRQFMQWGSKKNKLM
jgi:hypothetical protein